MSIPVPIAVQNESWYNSWWNQNPEDETDVGTLSHWDKEEGGGARCMEEMRGASFAGSSPPFLGREWAAVGVDVGPERRSPRYHETCLALESVKESSATVLEPRCVWLRVLIFKDLE